MVGKIKKISNKVLLAGCAAMMVGHLIGYMGTLVGVLMTGLGIFTVSVILMMDGIDSLKKGNEKKGP